MKNPLLVVSGTLALTEVAEHWTVFLEVHTESPTILKVMAVLLLALTAVGVIAIRKGLRS